MNYNRKTLLRRNTISSLLFELFTIANGFILPRFMLSFYGSATNGLVASITNFLGIISLCELGMGAVVPANLYKPLAEKNIDEVSAVVVSAQKFYRLIAVGMAGYVIVLAFFYPQIVDGFSSLFSGSLILIIAISSFAQYFFGISYSLLLKADQHQYISFDINSITLVINTILSVLMIVNGCSIHLVKLISSLVFVMRPMALNLYVRKNYNINLKIKYAHEPIKQKWNGIAQHIATAVQEKADTIILTLLSTLESVSVYSVYFMIVNGIRGFIYAATAGMSSLIGNMLANKEFENLKRTFLKFEWTMHTISILLFSVTGILIVPFVMVYTRGISDSEIYLEPLFGWVLCFALAARCIQSPYNIVVQAANHFKQTQTSAIIEPIINIVISVILVHKYGLIGVAIGTLVSMIYRVLYLAIYLMKNIIYLEPKTFIKQIFVDIISILIMWLSCSWIKFKPNSYFDWILDAVLVFLICIVICFIINLVLYPALIKDIFFTTLKRQKLNNVRIK